MALTISDFQWGNISDLPVCTVVLSDGSLTQVNGNTGTSTGMAPAGTIVNPNQPMGISQYGSQYILICAPQTNGYFIWDGKLFYQTGSIGPVVTITNGGQNYTSQPTITAVGGSGTGAAFMATLSSSGSITVITPTAVGSGYLVNDFVYLAFSGGGSKTSAIATAHISNGGVTSVTINNGGSGYTQISTIVTFVGGGGFGATGSAAVAGGAIASVSVSTTGIGYISAPTVVFNDPNNLVAQATVNVMPYGVQGSALETYAGRVWLVNGGAPMALPVRSLVTFSAPSNPSDFSVLDGAGAFVSSDSFLRVGFYAIKQSNGFLYLGGDSSWNYISGVTTTGNPPITVFSNQNVNPQIGTPWGDSAQVFSQGIMFGNTSGIYELIGGSVRKVSYPLDGFYSSIKPTGTLPNYNGLRPSAAVAIIFGINVYMQLTPIIDQFTGLPRNALLMYDGRYWFTASQSLSLIRIGTQEINSVLTAWGTDGTVLAPLFQVPSNQNKVVRSKLWDTPHYMMQKHATDVYGMFRVYSSDNVGFTVNVDTELESPQIFQSTAFPVTWLNNLGQTVTWTNTSGATVTWLGPSPPAVPFGPDQIDATGVLMGMTLQTTTQDMVLLSLSVAAQQYKPNI